jgi:hypothetical protein
MQYPLFQAQGCPIGSGMVESGNKLVVEARLKGPGMHWAETSVNPMLALRNLLCSGRWREDWPRIEARLRQQSRQRRKAVHQAHHPKLPTTLIARALQGDFGDPVLGPLEHGTLAPKPKKKPGAISHMARPSTNALPRKFKPHPFIEKLTFKEDKAWNCPSRCLPWQLTGHITNSAWQAKAHQALLPGLLRMATSQSSPPGTGSPSRSQGRSGCHPGWDAGRPPGRGR